MRKLILILFLFSSVLNAQIIDSNGKIITSPYRYITNDVSAWTVISGSYANEVVGAYNVVKCTSDGYAENKKNHSNEWFFKF